MGVAVMEPTPLVRGSVTTCTYKSTTLSHSVIIEYDTDATAASFAADQSTIESHQLVTTPISGIGDKAYSFSEESAQTTVNTVVSLSGSLQTIVTGTSSLSQVKNMSAEILDKIASTATTATTATTG
jgi:hypothetical protein